VSTPKGLASDRVLGDHKDRHHRRQNDTKDLPSAALARRTNVWGSVDACCGVSTAAPTTGCAEEMGRILGLLLERPSLGRVPGGREIPHVGKPTWRRPIGRRSRTRLGRLGQRPSTTNVHLFGATRKQMFDVHAGNDTTPAAVASGPTRRRLAPGASVLRGATLSSASNSRASSRFCAGAQLGSSNRARRRRDHGPRPGPCTCEPVESGDLRARLTRQ
jgi:hypothetical protein